MEKELSKKLLVWGSTIMVIQNIILMPSVISYQVSSLAFTPVFWLDLIGFGLIGTGMYFIGDFYTSVASFTKRTALAAFTWVILSAVWRLMFLQRAAITRTNDIYITWVNLRVSSRCNSPICSLPNKGMMIFTSAFI